MKQKILSLLAAVLLLGSAPLAFAQSLLKGQLRSEQQLHAILEEVHSGQQSIPKEQARQAANKEAIEEAKESMASIMREKRTVRLQIAEQKKLAEQFKIHYNLEPDDADELYEAYESRKAELEEFVRHYARLLAMQKVQQGQVLQRSLFTIFNKGALVEVDDITRQKVLFASHRRLLELGSSAQQIPELLTSLEKDHSELLDAYHGAAEKQDTAQYQIALSQQRLEEIKQIVAQVEERVRVMQLEMTRIDEKLRMKAEQDLVAMGLRSKQTTVVSRRAQYLWPVTGRRITATFYDPSYMAYFGVPHKAIDIAMPQASTVTSTADGIVYYVKNGGATGYSYILIGHRDGYATLYGHMLQSNVVKGQQVRQGQVIGLSGGMPGTNGAGPMTTGPHLHFEFIKNGTHIDPMTMLP